MQEEYDIYISLNKTLDVNLDIAFSLSSFDQGIALSGSRDGSIKFFDMNQEFKEVNRIENVFEGGVRALEVLDKNTFVASGSNYKEKFVKVFDYPTMTNIQTLTLQTGFAIKLLKLKNGYLAAATSFPDNSIYVWDSKNNFNLITRLNCCVGDVNCLLELEEGLLLSGTKYGAILVHDIKDNFKQKEYLSLNEGWVNDLISVDGKIISAHEKGFINVWDSEFKHLTKVNCEVGITALISQRGNIFLAGAEDGSITVWSLSQNLDRDENGNQLPNLTLIQTLKAHSGRVRDLLLVKDYLLSCSSDFSVKVWNFNKVDEI